MSDLALPALKLNTIQGIEMVPDIHILTIPSRSEWLKQAVDSLGGQPCNIHVLEQPSESNGVDRKLGFSKGNSLLVGFVDDDDLVEPGAIQMLIDALEANPDAVGAYTDEILIDRNGNFIKSGRSTGKEWSLRRHLGSPRFVHHIWVARRESVETYIDEVSHLAVAKEWALTAMMAIDGPWVHVPHVGYRWRQHDAGCHRNAVQHTEDIESMAKHIVRRWVDAEIMGALDVPLRLRSALL